MLGNNRVDSMEQVSVLGLCGKFIVNQPGLERLLRSHNQDGLGSSSTDTAEEVVSSVLFSQNVFLTVGVGAESNVVLGD